MHACTQLVDPTATARNAVLLNRYIDTFPLKMRMAVRKRPLLHHDSDGFATLYDLVILARHERYPAACSAEIGSLARRRKLHRSSVKGVGGVVARQPDDATALPFCPPGSEADKVFRPMCGDRSRERKSDHQTSCVKCCQGQPDDNHCDIGPPSQLWDGCGADRQASEQYSTDAQNDPKCRETKRSVGEHQSHETGDFEGWEGPQANQRFGIPDPRNVAMFAPPEPGHGIITTRRYSLIVPSPRSHAEIQTAGLGESRTSSPVRSVMGVCARPSIDSAVAHGDGAKKQTPYSRKMLVTTFGTSTS